MLLSFAGILENRTILWEDPQQLPTKAKVIVTVLEEIEQKLPQNKKTMANFDGIWENLSERKKNELADSLENLRNEWERTI